MKRSFKKATALALVLGLSLSTAVISYANVYIWADTSATDTGESRTFTYGTQYTFTNSVYQIADVNETLKFDSAKSENIGEIVELDYGYLEGDKFISTYHYFKEGVEFNRQYPVFDIVNVQNDQQAGITDRVYGLMVCVADNEWNGDVIPFLFRLSGTATTPPSQSQSEGWVQDATGWWYRNADGSYPVNTWKEIGGKQYYFDDNGYMLHDTTTPDGYLVGSDGAWIQ